MGIRKPRLDYDPSIPVKAVCPGCTARSGWLVTEDCPVCEGTGTITLGRPALMYDEPTAVSRAVGIVLEAAARQALGDHEQRARVAPRAVPEAVARLVRLGLIERRTP